ncbi:MAG: DUF5666 domain-containing protein [Patescibacteria group bacterium]|nr:DUF5666 domain-containing protein [Patescibacteria group bacterium]
MKKHTIILIIAILVAGGGGFFGGMQYQKQTAIKSVASSAAGTNRGNFAGTRTGGRTGANGGGFANGSILSKSDTSLTIKLSAGGSEIVFLAPSTQIMKSATTTIAALNVGDNVMVTGTANSDGSLTAKTVQAGDFRFGGARSAGTGQGQGGQGTATQTPPAQGQ